VSDFEILHHRAKAFYETFDRKADLRHQTHYCPGCGHGIVHKLIARAIDELDVQDRTVLVSPVGCSVFAYYYFDVGNVQAAHGRAPAVAAAIKRSLPHALVISYQGDGDLAAIGTAEILHAANRGEPITVFFVNNAIYGMTGGQVAPTTPIGERTITSPYGRSPWNEGYPLHVSEVLASLEAPVYIERVTLGNNLTIFHAGRAIKKALENQINGLGFSFIEILSPCPTAWKMQPQEAQVWVRDELTKIYPVQVFRDKTAETSPRPVPPPAPSLDEIPQILGSQNVGQVGNLRPIVNRPARVSTKCDYRIKVAGFGGQGVLMLGEILAEAGLDAGFEVSWLPSYGPAMRSGTSNCQVRLSSDPIDSPIVSHPNVLMALNEPSLHKFFASVAPGGCVLYNGTSLPEDAARTDLTFIIHSFTELGDRVGDPPAGNIVMLGALLEATGMLEDKWIDGALRRLVKSELWLDLDRKALALGRTLPYDPQPIPDLEPMPDPQPIHDPCRAAPVRKRSPNEN
jgi:2-oxoisovalerate ferredoxin oxidoreductase beta subunit